MMQVDLVKCAGCGECLDACPVEAITMVGGKAAIDTDTCLACGACLRACLQGAIVEYRLPVPVIALDYQPEAAHLMTYPSHSENRLAWAGPVLSFVGREILPRVVDSLIVALDRRLSSPTEVRVVPSTLTEAPSWGRRRQVRQRRRRRSFE